MTDPETAEVSQDVEWMTPFPMDGVQPVFVADDDSPWHVIPHWAMVDGKALLVGLDIRSFVEDMPDDARDAWPSRRPVAGHLQELTQKVLRGIPLSAVRDESRKHLADKLGALAGGLPDSPLQRRAGQHATAMTASGKPRRRRPSASDDLLVRVAQLYAKAEAVGQGRAPARFVEQELRREGFDVSTRGGRDQVRKWIQRARERKLLPPVV
ncbi:hypothetical protein GCM10010124_38230 [Pilimelia terevasa]|uniref:Uncharacterized protein n=1 Tax=Pilimelia terevasa TaxID=53372 RepID=A0A8J3BVQ4_9ACTN|nr:hypothetical protein [Pilimelia terevasa]GGK41778.1 hypothetical protein GCM10010124_38230 [Pilimelia terevasa]